MNGIRMDTVKQTAIDILRRLQPNDIFSLVKFNDWAELLISPSGIDDLQSIEMKIQLLQTDGGTEIYKGLEMGFAQVYQHLSSKMVNHIVLITDGRTYGDEEDCQKLADQASALGIGISALGIGNEWNDAFLDQIASKTGGISKYIPVSGDIRNSILEEISRLGTSVTEQINFSYHTPSNVNLNSAFRLHPDASPLLINSPINFGFIPNQGSMSVMLEFEIGSVVSHEDMVTLANGFINYEIPRHADKSRNVQRLSLSRQVTSQAVNEPVPPVIQNAISFLSLYHIQERAREDIHQGNVKSATTRLENLASRLLQKGEHSLAQTVMSEVTQIKNTQALSIEGEKLIKYGTRSLLMPTRPKDKPG